MPNNQNFSRTSKHYTKNTQQFKSLTIQLPLVQRIPCSLPHEGLRTLRKHHACKFSLQKECKRENKNLRSLILKIQDSQQIRLMQNICFSGTLKQQGYTQQKEITLEQHQRKKTQHYLLWQQHTVTSFHMQTSLLLGTENYFHQQSISILVEKYFFLNPFLEVASFRERKLSTLHQVFATESKWILHMNLKREAQVDTV